MKYFNKILSVLIISILIFTGSFGSVSFNANAETIVTAFIEGTNVNVRSEPSTASNVTIYEKLSNTSVTVLEQRSDGWLKVTYHNGTKQVTGYIKNDPSYIRIVTYNTDATFEQKLKAFPSSYHSALKTLHAAYPNWEFLPDPVAYSFTDAVNLESPPFKQVDSKYISWRTMAPGSYDWNSGKWISNNGSWFYASREIIAFYMDPRNFLNSTEIYQFLEQSYNPTFQTKEGLAKIVSGTFLAGNYTESGKTHNYIDVIMSAALASKVNPYIIASKIIQEQGTKGTSNLISGNYSGYVGYYNFFNVNATGKTDADVIRNGLIHAKAQGWNTREKSIIGGANFLAKNYISKGQDTYYYQDFDIKVNDGYIHQFAQAVHDARNKGANMADTYKNEKNLSLSFKIPVFTDMPSSASPKPVQNSKLNNYYFESIKIDGLTPTFNKFTYNYNLQVTGNSTVYVKPVSGATYAGASSYSLNKGNNVINLKVKSATGYIMDYTVNVNATKACTLTVSTGSAPATPSTPSTPSTPTVTIKKGDANGDGAITIRDLADVRLHLLGLKKLSGDKAKAADVNGDGGIAIRDLADIRLHLLGLKTIK
ncbi:MAG: SH3 domain-containing protein [Clostridia bacterium]|nr:SH3 domain-containing protein [Clostridia bacterium]